MTSKLFVGGLGGSTTATGLWQAFEPFGPLSDAIVVADRLSGRSMGFGFVTFSDLGCASDALNRLDGQALDGHRIAVAFAGARYVGPRQRH